jgi:hypothetical protein
MSRSVLLNDRFTKEPSAPTASTSQTNDFTSTTPSLVETTCIWETKERTLTSRIDMEAAWKATTLASTTEDDATAMLRVLMQTLETLPLNDGTFRPKQFSGSLKDTYHVDKWLEPPIQPLTAISTVQRRQMVPARRFFDHRPTALPSGAGKETASQQFPSKAIRHPQYIGIVLFTKFLALPLLCGSMYTLDNAARELHTEYLVRADTDRPISYANVASCP